MAEIVGHLRVFRGVQGRLGTSEIIWWSGLNRDLAAFWVTEGLRSMASRNGRITERAGKTRISGLFPHGLAERIKPKPGRIQSPWIKWRCGIEQSQGFLRRAFFSYLLVIIVSYYILQAFVPFLIVAVVGLVVWHIYEQHKGR